MWYGVTTVSEPTEEPVTLTEAKSYLKIDVSTDDTPITSMIGGARRWLEHVLRQRLVTQTVEHPMDCWPNPHYRLPEGPVQSISSISYVMDDGTSDTVDSATYTLVDGRIMLATSTATWPSVSLRRYAPITVRYVVGYGDAEDVPRDLVDELLAYLSVQWFNRDELASDSERQIRRLETRLRGKYGRAL